MRGMTRKGGADVAGFPFTAIVGQETLKQALLLNVIQPTLGGVLVRGTKGVAKSTAVRALAGLLPPLETVAGCPFQRRPGEVVPDWPVPDEAAVVVRPVPLVELPLGATEDRVLGALHLERALRGERVFEPGLLAAANRGILYIDEINLLPDHLVDVLLDAAASGVHRVEREGLSLSHPARFVLVGTMNPEEGDLRPQLLDRFGLVVDVTDLADPAERAEAVRRRLAYETNPEAFTAAWQAQDQALAQRLRHAQRLLPEVRLGDGLLRLISERCLAAGVEGLRADLTLARAACAWAAYQGRTAAEPADVEAVAELALAHRRTRPPTPPPPSNGDRERKADDSGRAGSAPAPAPASPGPTLRFESAGLFAARVQPPAEDLERAVQGGRRRAGRAWRHGPVVGAVRPGYGPGQVLSWAATLRAAAARQARPGAVAAEDLRSRPRRGPAGCLLLFVVDASGSMAAWQRMRQTKAAVLALLLQAYQQRDRVALLAFRGTGAELVLPPTRGLHTARAALERLPVGGTTPLAAGLAAARRLAERERRRQPGQPIWTVILTDGRANAPGGTPWQEALGQAAALARCDVRCLVVDTETGWPRLGRAVELARALGAAYQPLEEVLGRRLPWRSVG